MSLVMFGASLGWAQEVSSEKLNAWVSEVKRETETPIGETGFRERQTEYGTASS